MKKTALCVCIFFKLLYPLIAQDAFYLEEYNDLQPDVNVLDGNMFKNDRRALLFYSPLLPNRKLEPVFLCNLPSNVLTIFPAEQIGKEQSHMESIYFWDPHTRRNYMYCRDIFNSGNEERGWYSLAFNNGFLAFYLQNTCQDAEYYSPPRVQLNNNRVYTAQYEFEQKNIRSFTSHNSSFKITDTFLSKIVWEFNIASSSFANLYWISEQWYLRLLKYSCFALGVHERQNTIYNYVTEETVSFSPEIIIGYGKGVVLTTMETEKGFIGITIWTPEKEILYRDSNFSISGITECEPNPATWGTPSIYRSYFDYPYIYVNVGRGWGLQPPYGTLILNLIDGKTFYTPYGYHLFAIF